VGVVDALQAELSLHLLTEQAVDLSHEGSRHLSAKLAVVAEQRPEAPGEGADPMAYRALARVWEFVLPLRAEDARLWCTCTVLRAI
jgi:hypothetical protein